MGIHSAFPVVNAAEGKHKYTYSFLLCSRDDNYLGNSTRRLATVLRLLIEDMGSAGLAATSEILLVDWNSPVPISDNPVIRHTLYHLYRDPVLGPTRPALQIIRVPPVVAEKYAATPVSEVHALNAGARRASGRLVLRLDQDTMVDRVWLSWLQQHGAAHLDKWWWGDRRGLGHGIYEVLDANLIMDHPRLYMQLFAPIKVWDQLCAPITDGSSFCPIGYGSVGVFGVPAAVWQQTLGYNELYTGWGHMEVEFKDRIVASGCQGIRVSDVAEVISPFWHIPHERANMPRPTNNWSYPFENRADSWGLGQEVLNGITFASVATMPEVQTQQMDIIN